MPDWNLARIADQFQQAAFDPALWPNTLHALSRSIGALGAVMLPLDHRVPGVPHSPDLEAMLATYLREGWDVNDDRDQGVPLILRRGVVVDQDFITPDGMRRPYYTDFLERHGCRWFAGLGHLSQSGFHAISIQRTIRQGPFESDEVRALSTLCRPFADAAFLSRRLSLKRCEGLTDAMAIMRQPAIVTDASGRVLALNALAERTMGNGLDLTRRTLVFQDAWSQANFERLLADAMSPAVAPGELGRRTTVRDLSGMPISLRAITLRDWARFTFTGAHTLLLFDRPQNETLLRATFGLTKAELKLALLLAAGHSVAESAVSLGIAYETARAQLRSVFIKTHTNRQGQLTALIRQFATEKGAEQ